MSSQSQFYLGIGRLCCRVDTVPNGDPVEGHGAQAARPKCCQALPEARDEVFVIDQTRGRTSFGIAQRLREAGGYHLLWVSLAILFLASSIRPSYSASDNGAYDVKAVIVTVDGAMSEGSGRCRKRIKCVVQVGSDVTLYIIFESHKYVVNVVGPEESVKMYCCASHEESAPYFTFDSKEVHHYTQLNYSRVSHTEPLKMFGKLYLIFR
jgi:hypothetical protein